MYNKYILVKKIKKLILFVLFLYSNTYFLNAANKKNLKIIEDKVLPTGIGCQFSYSTTTACNAIVPGEGLTYHALANVFAFKVDGQSRTALPSFAAIGGEFYIYHDILNRNIWLLLYSYPRISYGAAYRQYNLFKPMSAISILGTIDLTLFNNYDSKHCLFPKLGFGVGYFKGAIGSEATPLSHPIKKEKYRITPDENLKPTFFYNSLNYLFRTGIGYRYKITNRWFFVFEILLEYNLLGKNFDKTIEIDIKNDGLPKSVEGNDNDTTKDDKDKPPRPVNASFYSYTFSTKLECTFNPAKRKFLRYDLPPNRHTGEVGIFILNKQFSKMNYIDRDIYYNSLLNKMPHANINFRDQFWGIGLQGLYSYRLISKFCFLSAFELVLYDSMVKRKLKAMDFANNNETRISILGGIGGDYNIIKLRFFTGYDVITSDFLTEHILYSRLSKLFFKIGGGLTLFKHIGISMYAKVRPRQTYLKGLSIMYDSFELSFNYVF